MVMGFLGIACATGATPVFTLATAPFHQSHVLASHYRIPICHAMSSVGVMMSPSSRFEIRHAHNNWDECPCCGSGGAYLLAAKGLQRCNHPFQGLPLILQGDAMAIDVIPQAS